MKKIVLFVFLSLMQTAYGADKLTVLLDWFPNPDHAPLYVAKERGFFQQHNLDVELIGPADPSDPPKLVAAGKADIAITFEPQFLEQIDQGLPLIWIASLINQPLNCLVVLKNSTIKSLVDLKGKRIGTTSSSTGSVMLNVMLQKAGLTPQDVEIINIHYDLTQALLSKNVDAVTGMMRNFELTQMELAGIPGLAFYPEQHGLPNYSELILVTKKSAAPDPKIERFLAALKEGVIYLQKHPEESWALFAKAHPELNNTLNRRAWFDTVPYFTANPAKFKPQEILRFANFMQQNGLIKKVQPITTYIADKE